MEILERHKGDDDQFYGTPDWEPIFLKSTTGRMKNNPAMYPPFNVDTNIFNNDESDYGDARSEETDFQDAVDDSDYDPEEDSHGQDDEDSEEEITWAGDQEEVLPGPDFDVVIPEQDPEAEIHDHHPADYDDHPEPYQYQDDVKNLLPVVTARQTLHNNSHNSNQLVPVGYDDLGYQKKLIKDKVYNLGPKQLDFGKYKKFELWWVVKHDPGYVHQLVDTPAIALQLAPALLEGREPLPRPEAEVGSRPDARLRAVRHELPGTPGGVGSVARVRLHQKQPELYGQETPRRKLQAIHQPAGELLEVHKLRQTAVLHRIRSRPTSHPVRRDGPDPRDLPAERGQEHRAHDHHGLWMSRRSVAGRDGHSKLIRWTQKYWLQPQTKSTKESFEFGGGEVVHSTRSLIYVPDHVERPPRRTGCT